MAPHHLPFYLAPGSGTDVLMVVMGIFLVATVLWVGTLYWRLHSLPERMAHKSEKLQFEIVAILGLLSLFTHIHLFWVAGLLLALIDIPDFGTPLRSIAGSVEKIADAAPEGEGEAEPKPGQLSPLAATVRRSRRRQRAARRGSAAMFELMICSLLTIVPDYLYRRYVQGKRFGKEITFYSVWYELRWGITGCLMLTISLITMIFYFHPSTTSATLYFRTVPILPEGSGRVAEVNVGFSAPVKKGDVLFRLDSSKQEAALETAKRKIAEVDAATGGGGSRRDQGRGPDPGSEERASAGQGRIGRQERVAASQSRDRAATRHRKAAGAGRSAPGRHRRGHRRQAIGDRCGFRRCCRRKRRAPKRRWRRPRWISTRPSSAPASTGGSSSSRLRAGDVVNPLMRPAGILIPEGAGQRVLQAGFGQIEAQVMKEGMVAEATCISKPWVIIPMVVTTVQDYIAAGQFRGGEQLVEAQNVAQTRHDPGVPGAALQGRSRRGDGRQQLHRQRLHQQSRGDFRKGHQHRPRNRPARRRRRRPGARHCCCGSRRCCCRSRRWC